MGLGGRRHWKNFLHTIRVILTISFQNSREADAEAEEEEVEESRKTNRRHKKAKKT